jgi:hypothetical protein
VAEPAQDRCGKCGTVIDANRRIDYMLKDGTRVCDSCFVRGTVSATRSGGTPTHSELGQGRLATVSGQQNQNGFDVNRYCHGSLQMGKLSRKYIAEMRRQARHHEVWLRCFAPIMVLPPEGVSESTAMPVWDSRSARSRLRKTGSSSMTRIRSVQLSIA